MKRSIYNKLIEWKISESRKPLILKGARQVGKTWVLKEFGANEYSAFVYLNCESTPELKAVFDIDFDTDRILRSIEALSGVTIIPDKTLIVLDEAQECPKIITALKYFQENRSDIHIAIAGSLLGLSLHGGVSFPVGKVDFLEMYPMTFIEFLWAVSEDVKAQAIWRGDWAVLSPLHQKLTDLLRQYYFVGGMPEAVMEYVSGAPLAKIREVQNGILRGYKQDFSKHAPANQVPRVNMVWDSVPSQLARENKKFIYGAVRKSSRASDFEIAIQWLADAGLVYKIRRVRKIEAPLKFYEDFDSFKLYTLDVGLFGAMNDTPADKILIGDDIFSEYKGAFTELFVVSQFIPSGIPIYYYSRDNSQLEVDMVTEIDGRVYAVEIKAEENVKSKSLRVVADANPHIVCARFSMLPHRQQSWMTNYPLYAAGCPVL